MSRGGESGFGFFELVVAIVALSIGVLALAGASLGLAAHAERAEARTRLRLHAQAQMERLLAVHPERLAPGSRREGGAEVSWEVDGSGPWTLRLVARQRRGRATLADTLVTIVAWP